MGLDMYGGTIRKEEASCEGQVFFSGDAIPTPTAGCSDCTLPGRGALSRLSSTWFACFSERQASTHWSRLSSMSGCPTRWASSSVNRIPIELKKIWTSLRRPAH